MIPERSEGGARAGHVELATLDVLEAACPSGGAWLSDDERARVASIGAALRRRQFVAGHWLARVIAARVLAVSPGRIGMDRDGAGRPRLLLDGAPAPWHVSLTHSDERVACAVAPVAVGIDLEVPRRARDLAALARFTFSGAEVARMDDVPADQRVVEFYRLWALKEARGKRCGEGMLPRRARRASTEPATPREADAITWTFGDVTLAVAAAGAGDFVASGVPADARVAHWRVVDAA